jgi:hypothetical protein
MRTFRFAPLWALAIALLSLASCDKKEDKPAEGDTTVAQDKENITNTFNQAVSCVATMKSGDFTQSAFKFMNLQAGEILDEAWVSDITEKLDDIMDLEGAIDNGRFDMAVIKGTYTWNHTTKTWVKSTVSGNQVVVLFPESKTATTNTYELRLSEYTDAKYVIQGDDVYMPTSVKASLKKNNVEIMNVNSSSQYASSGFPAPISSRLSVLTAPYTIIFDISRVNDKTFAFTFELDNGSCGKTSFQTKTYFNHNDYENYFDGESETSDLDLVEFKLAKNDLLAEVTFDVKKYNTFSDPTEAQINSCVKATLSFKGFKIGDLQLKEVNNNTELFIVYKDGTSENATKYIDPFIEDVKQVLRPQLDL